MNRIELRGVIVPSEYDLSWAQPYIDKGILTPESTFRARLAKADPSQPLDVYVNSPGGSVFAANEMVNAVREWKVANKQPVNVTVGAMAASAASAFTIMAADTVRAHKNAKMMLHGARTMSIGGKELHADAADLLGKINGDIKARLVSKYNLSPEVVSEWFAEGREGWLTADEMKGSGIASEVIGDAADMIEFPADAVASIEKQGLGIAALLESNKSNEAKNYGQPANPPAAEPAAVVEPEPAATVPDPAEPAAVAPAVQPAAVEPSAERIAGRAEGRADAHAEFADRLTALQARADASEDQARAMQSERDRAVSALAKANAQHAASLSEMSDKLKEANARVAKFLDGALSFSTAPATWSEALDQCQGDYVKARQTFPAVYQAFMQQTTKTK